MTIQRDFLKEFRNNVKAIDQAITALFPPKPIEILALYNVHKRSLPTGLDKIVAFRVLDSDKKHLSKYFKTHLKNDIIYYYDFVPLNATEDEKNVFYNPKKFIR